MPSQATFARRTAKGSGMHPISSSSSTESAPSPTGRSLASYLLLPRPGDRSKWAIIPATFGIGSLVVGVSPEEAAKAALVWFAVEYLVYQARYQWNDIRGFAADQAHPDSAARGRLPGPARQGRRNVAISQCVATARLALAAGLGPLLDDRVASTCLYLSTVGVLSVAVAYELLRAAGTGKMLATQCSRRRPAVIGIWVVSGAGYAVRGVTGLALSADLSSRPQLGVAAATALWSGGVAFVTSRWAVESLAFAQVSQGRVLWRASATQAREHLVLLAHWLPAQAPDQFTSADLRSWEALRPVSRLSAPWNVATVLSAASAALTGLMLAEAGTERFAAWTTVALALGLAAALAVLRWPSWLLLGAVLVISALAADRAGLSKPGVAVMPLAVALALHITSRCQRLNGIGGAQKQARRSLITPTSPSRPMRAGMYLAPHKPGPTVLSLSNRLAKRARL
jgi:hypothetical protein